MHPPGREALDRTSSYKSPRKSQDGEQSSPFSFSNPDLLLRHPQDGERVRTDRLAAPGGGTGHADPTASRPTLLGRLHQVLARVRGGDKPEQPAGRPSQVSMGVTSQQPAQASHVFRGQRVVRMGDVAALGVDARIVALSQSIWAHHVGVFPVPKLTDMYREPSIST